MDGTILNHFTRLMATNTLPIVFEGGHYRLRGVEYESYGLVVILDALGVKGIWKSSTELEPCLLRILG